MPITKSAKKAIRQTKTRRARNLRRIGAYRDAVKQFRKLTAGGKIHDAKAMLSKVYQTLDKASKAGVIKPNKASRLKSSAMHAVAKK